jgi:hypothetical protein
MPRFRRMLAACVAVLAFGLTAAGLAMAASPLEHPGVLDVYRDYQDNHRFDSPHDVGDIRLALAEARGDVGYQDFAEAAQDALDHYILGRSVGNREGLANEVPDSTLPTPRGLDESAHPPLALIGLSAMAALLMVGGAGSAAYRRLRRAPAGALAGRRRSTGSV